MRSAGLRPRAIYCAALGHALARADPRDGSRIGRLVTTDDHQDIERLRRIQEQDQQIADLTGEAEALPAQVRQWEDAIQAHTIQKAMVARQNEELALKQRRHEAEIATRQELRAKYNTQLSQVKTNREYRALLDELEVVNGQIRGIEDIVLDAMTNIEAVEEEIALQDEAITGEELKIAENRERLDAEYTELQQRIAAVQAERDSVSTEVDRRLLTRYERVRDRRGGAALAELDSAQGTCGGCHISLRLQEVNEILGGALVQCQSCGRLLYFDENPTPSATS